MVVVHSDTQSTGDPAFRQVLASVSARLRTSDAVASVVPPRPGATVSRDGHTAIVTAGSSGTPTEAVAAADELKHDLAQLGRLGAVPGYPGEDVVPTQPMVSQLRSVLQAAGDFTELVYEDCGHSPHLEHPERFARDVRSFLE